MIVRYQKNMLNHIMKIWLDENLRTHFFISSEFWKENFDNVKKEIDNADIWVYIKKEKILGFIGVIGDGYVAGLFVDKNFQGNGIGRELLEYIKKKFDVIKLKVFLQNKKAIDFYRYNGFIVTGSKLFDSAYEQLEMCWKNTYRVPNFKWQEQWQKKRLELKAPIDINRYFTSNKINCQTINCKNGGYLAASTGFLMVIDPFNTEKDEYEKPFFHTVHKGMYPITLSCIQSDNNLIASLKVTFGDGIAIDYDNAMRGNENLSLLKTQDYFGTYSESGFLAICDEKVWTTFKTFQNNWQLSNKGKDIFKSLFQPLLIKNNNAICFLIPDSDEKICIFESGYGEGCYPAYFGYDANGIITNLVIQLIDIEQAYEIENET